MPEEVVAATSSAAEGTGAEVGTNDLGTTSTESVGNEAVSGSEEPTYEILVDGRTEKVTFDELQKGYMRQADYTRKTQAVAQQRAQVSQVEQLAQALETNPQGTVRALAAALGVTIDQAGQAFAPTADEDDPIARLERGVNALSQQFQAQQQQTLTAQQEATKRQNAQAQIQNELQILHQQWGDFPDNELIQYAVDRNIHNLDVAHRAWRFDAAEAKRVAELNAATEAKRRSQVVSGGTNPAAGAVTKGTAGAKPTIREAWAAAVAANS